MNENDTLFNEIDSEYDYSSPETYNSDIENEIISDENEVSASNPSERSEPGLMDQKLSDEETEAELEELPPTSTVIQVTPDETDPESYTIDELDVRGLNAFIQAENEIRSVTPTSNDYYTFISGDIEEYFSGVMANYPLNDYKAVHLKHYVSSGSYSSYYDDYYYLWFNYPNTECIEIYKANNSSQYRVSVTTQSDLSASITYGSGVGQSDLRKGVSYVQEMGLLLAVGVCLVLYILHAIFKHLAS